MLDAKVYYTWKLQTHLKPIVAIGVKTIQQIDPHHLETQAANVYQCTQRSSVSSCTIL